MHSKTTSKLEAEFTDAETNLNYNVIVRKDASSTQQLVSWDGSPKFNVKSTWTARCELIVQANDPEVSI